MRKGMFALAAAGVLVVTASAEERPGFPRMRLQAGSTVAFDPGSALLTMQADIRTARFAAGEVVALETGSELELNVRLSAAGEVIDGGLGDDLVIRGALDRDGDGVFETQGDLLRGEMFNYRPISNEGSGHGRRQIGVVGQNVPNSGDLLLRFAPTGGALLDLYAGHDIGLLLKPGSTGNGDLDRFAGGGSIGLLGTVRGACCQFPNSCSEVTEVECDGLGGDFEGVGSTCELPESPLATGQHRLVGRPFGGLADAGLVLDALDGDEATTFAYSFSAPGAEVLLDYDGSVAHITGTAIGGPLSAGLGSTDETIRFEFAYSNATVAGGQIVAPGSALAFGFVERVEAGQIVVLENGAGGLVIDGSGALDGDLRYLQSERGTVRVFNAQLAEARPTCAASLGACCGFDGSCSQTTIDACDTLSGAYAGDDSDCGDDADGDGVADACDICPGGDDLLDTDGDGIPNYCDSDPGISNGGCCLSFGCIILDADDCALNGGVYQGDGTSCWECN